MRSLLSSLTLGLLVLSMNLKAEMNPCNLGDENLESMLCAYEERSNETRDGDIIKSCNLKPGSQASNIDNIIDYINSDIATKTRIYFFDAENARGISLSNINAHCSDSYDVIIVTPVGNGTDGRYTVEKIRGNGTDGAYNSIQVGNGTDGRYFTPVGNGTDGRYIEIPVGNGTDGFYRINVGNGTDGITDKAYFIRSHTEIYQERI